VREKENKNKYKMGEEREREEVFFFIPQFWAIFDQFKACSAMLSILLQD
jgi:hypothetical protein